MVLCAPAAYAQYTADFQTNLISGVTSNWTGNYVIGSNTFADALLIQSSGVLSNGKGYLGYDPSGSNNTVLVSGTGSVWTNRGTLVVGLSAMGNSLVISNGGRVFVPSTVPIAGPTDCYVGYQSSGSNNTVVVTDPGSIWKTGDGLLVGLGGSWNSLVIENGGLVSGHSSAVGFNSGSRHNSVLVSDSGSVWSNFPGLLSLDSLYIGYDGTDNSLTISNGGAVIDSTVSVYLGYQSDSSNNSVRVAAGGTWQNNTLYVGYAGSSNVLKVTGGTVLATNLTVGFASALCNNLLEVDSGSVVVTNATHDAPLEVRHGKLVLSGGVVQADQLVITNSCASFLHTGGTLLVGSFVINPSTFRITSVAREGKNVRVTWMMGPGQTNTLQATSGDGNGGYSTNGFSDIFVVTNNASAGTVTNYLDPGAATNVPARYYRARLVP